MSNVRPRHVLKALALVIGALSVLPAFVAVGFLFIMTPRIVKESLLGVGMVVIIAFLVWDLAASFSEDDDNA